MERSRLSRFELLVSLMAQVDALNREVGDLVADAIMRHAKNRDTITPAVAARIRRDVDRALNGVYGPTRQMARHSRLFRTIQHATDFVAELSYREVLREVRRTVDGVAPGTWRELEGALAASEKRTRLARTVLALDGSHRDRLNLLRSGTLDLQRRWVDGSRYRLSDRIWRVRSTLRARINRDIKEAIRTGKGPLTLARELEVYLKPEHAPVRFHRDGRVVRRAGSARGGSGATYARRLARTELSRINAQAVEDAVAALEIDGAGIRYMLSPAHPKRDICDDRARGHSRGMPAGVYRPGEFPRIPQHPHCLCVAVPYLPSPPLVLKQLRDRYDLPA